MFIAGPIDENNMFEWEAYIKGPDETPFEGGVFCARLSFPRDYPLNPPKVRCRVSGLSRHELTTPVTPLDAL